MRENYIFVNIIKNVLCLNTSISEENTSISEEVIFTIYSTAIVCVGDRRSDTEKPIIYIFNAKHPWNYTITTLNYAPEMVIKNIIDGQ